MKPLIVFVPGHGGFTDWRVPRYATAPSKMVRVQEPGDLKPRLHELKMENGVEVGYFYEGVWNREVVKLCVESVRNFGIDAINPIPEWHDTSLDSRIEIVEKLTYGRRAFLAEIHANAGGGHGMEIFTTRGVTQSDLIASRFIENFRHATDNRLPIRMDWSDGDADKEANFKLIRSVRCPAVLMEGGFMDNRTDLEILLDPDYKMEIATAWSMTAADIFF